MLFNFNFYIVNVNCSRIFISLYVIGLRISIIAQY